MEGSSRGWVGFWKEREESEEGLNGKGGVMKGEEEEEEGRERECDGHW